MSITTSRIREDSAAPGAAGYKAASANEIEELVWKFEAGLRDIISYDSFEFIAARQPIHLIRGIVQLHRCNYGLRIAEQSRGEIILTRSSPFKESELILFEQHLAALAAAMTSAAD